MVAQDMKKQQHKELVAGINAALKIKGEEPMILTRSRCICRCFNR